MSQSGCVGPERGLGRDEARFATPRSGSRKSGRCKVRRAAEWPQRDCTRPVPAMRPPAGKQTAANGQKSGSRPAIDRTASNPAAIRPEPETTCIARRHASGVRPGWIVRTSTAVRSTGTTMPPGSAAVIRAIDERHLGQAPSKRTFKGGRPGSVTQPAQPRPRDERQVRRQHRQSELGQARAHHGDPQVQGRHAGQHQRACDADPDQDRVEQFQGQAGVGQEIDDHRPPGHRREIEEPRTHRQSSCPRGPCHSTTTAPGVSPGRPCRRSRPGATGSAAGPGWPTPSAPAPPARRPRPLPPESRQPPPRLPPSAEEPIERHRLAAGPRDRQVERQRRDAPGRTRTARPAPAARSRPRSPRPARPSIG